MPYVNLLMTLARGGVYPNCKQQCHQSTAEKGQLILCEVPHYLGLGLAVFCRPLSRCAPAVRDPAGLPRAASTATGGRDSRKLRSTLLPTALPRDCPIVRAQPGSSQ